MARVVWKAVKRVVYWVVVTLIALVVGCYLDVLWQEVVLPVGRQRGWW
jgi:hypothetical protein